ncbi:MAG: serine/threonine-protein kinase [Planctomycetota bacterium]
MSGGAGESPRPDAALPPSEDAGGAEGRLAELLAEGEIDATAALAAGEDPAALARLLALHELAELGLEALQRGVPPALVEGVEIGRKVGPYRLLAEIATGGMGALYLARYETLGRIVAVKLLARPGAAPARRFQREAEIVAGLKHPNVVEIYGRGEADGVQYIAMRYVAGHDVARTWRELRAGADVAARDLERPLRWMTDAARALHHAHEHGVVHRDVKPANLLVEDDHLYVVDFGLATSDDALELTRSGDLLGTVPYMAPEQLRGRRDEVDRRVDVYGLGVSLHELLAGGPPFTGPTSEAVARQILRRDPPPLARHGVPRDLEAIVTRAMEKDPDARYPTARDLAEDLERFLAREPVRARHLGPLRRAGRRASRHPGIVAAVGLVLVGLVVATLAWRNARDERRRADDARHDGAVAAAARGDYRRAGAILEELRSGGAEIEGLRAERDRFRVFAIHDDLMRIAFIPRGDERGDASVARAPETVSAMLAELDDLPVPDAMRDRLRMIEVLFLRREGRADEARRRLDAWGAEPAAAPRRLAAWRAMVDRGDGDDPEAVGRLLAALDAHPVRDVDDHYFAAIAASRLDGAESRGLFEIERFLVAVPGDYWGRHTKGNLLRRLGRLGEAREVYSGIIGSIAGGEDAGDPRLGAAYWQRGLVTARLGRFAEAGADFERSRAVIRPGRSSSRGPSVRAARATSPRRAPPSTAPGRSSAAGRDGPAGAGRGRGAGRRPRGARPRRRPGGTLRRGRGLREAARVGRRRGAARGRRDGGGPLGPARCAAERREPADGDGVRRAGGRDRRRLGARAAAARSPSARRPGRVVRRATRGGAGPARRARPRGRRRGPLPPRLAALRDRPREPRAPLRSTPPRRRERGGASGLGRFPPSGRGLGPERRRRLRRPRAARSRASRRAPAPRPPALRPRGPALLGRRARDRGGDPRSPGGPRGPRGRSLAGLAPLPSRARRPRPGSTGRRGPRLPPRPRAGTGRRAGPRRGGASLGRVGRLRTRRRAPRADAPGARRARLRRARTRRAGLGSLARRRAPARRDPALRPFARSGGNDQFAARARTTARNCCGLAVVEVTSIATSVARSSQLARRTEPV